MNGVVITGIGAVTPLGLTFGESWRGLLDGGNGIEFYDDLGVLAGRVKGFDPAVYMTERDIKRYDRFIQFAIAAASMAVMDSGIDCDRIGGVVIGSSRGGISGLDRAVTDIVGYGRRPSPYLMPGTITSMAASYIARRMGIKGQCLGISNACSSGSTAIGEAYRLIAHGYAEAVICGGSEAPLCPVCIHGYRQARALTKSSSVTACRPFAMERDGFVLSEGACVMVLEERSAAAARGAGIYARLAAYVNNTDGYDMVRPDVSGEVYAMRRAVKEGGGARIDLINAHAASTELGDRAEAEAILQVFPKGVPVTANKSATGHMLAASGAFEAACTAASIRYGVIPGTINTTEIDTACGIELVLDTKKSEIDSALSNSFGFGGLNTIIAFTKDGGG